MSTLHFIWAIAWAAFKASYADLGTNPLGWFVGIFFVPFVVVIVNAYQAPKGERWYVVQSAWKSELRVTSFLWLVILIALILWEGLYGIPHSIRTEAANWPAPTIRPYLSFAVIPGIEARPVLGSSPVSSRSPLLIKLDIYNDGFARITNEGVNSVRDIEVDISEQEMDMAYPPRGHEEDAVPKVKASSFWSSPFELLHEELKSEKTSRFDLKKIIDFNTLPETNAAARAMSPEKENEIERTFFVFRFTFRDNRTGEKYGCFKIHASYLKYPSAVDDNVGLYATPAYSRFITQLEETAIAVAKNHYKDGAMVFQCEN